MDTVRFYDVETGQIAHIPVAELAPGAVRARVEGIDGVVWLLPDKLQPGDIKHRPFAEEVRQQIHQIQLAFAEQHPLSFDEWEEGFRRDANPGPEIAIWLHAAAVYTEFASDQPSAHRRRDVFRCVVACMTSSADTVQHVLSPEVLTRREATAIADRYFRREG